MSTQLKRLKRQLGVTGTTEDELLTGILKIAKDAILSRRYPFGNFPEILDSRYNSLQIRIAVYLYNKRGAEGETSHSENGISRTYESADIPESLLREVVPLVAFPFAEE